MAFKVIDFGINRKRACNFLLRNLQNAKMRVGDLWNKLQKALWLVGQNQHVSQITKHDNDRASV